MQEPEPGPEQEQEARAAASLAQQVQVQVQVRVRVQGVWRRQRPLHLRHAAAAVQSSLPYPPSLRPEPHRRRYQQRQPLQQQWPS